MTEEIYNPHNYPTGKYNRKTKTMLVSSSVEVKRGDIFIDEHGWERQLGEPKTNCTLEHLSGIRGELTEYEVLGCTGKEMPPDVVKMTGIKRMNTAGFSNGESGDDEDAPRNPEISYKEVQNALNDPNRLQQIKDAFDVAEMWEKLDGKAVDAVRKKYEESAAFLYGWGGEVAGLAPFKKEDIDRLWIRSIREVIYNIKTHGDPDYDPIQIFAKEMVNL